MKLKLLITIFLLIISGIIFPVLATKTVNRNMSIIPPSPPTGLFVIAGDGQVELRWNKNSEFDFSKYFIYAGTSANPTTVVDTSFSVSDTSKIITGLTNGTLYYFRLKAFNNFDLFSDFSAEDAAVPVSGPGNSLSLSASSSQRIDVPVNSAPIGNSSYTIEAWIKPTSMSSFGIAGWGNYSTTNQVNAFRLGSGNYLINYWWGNDLSVQVGDLSGNWHHVAATFDGTTRKIYLDGNVVGSDTPTGHNVSGNSNLAIGKTYSTEYFNGEIDELRIWNVARTVSQINDDILIPLRGDEPGLAVLFHFDEPSGSVAFDATTFGNNGTRINNPAVSVSGAMNPASLPVELTSFSFSGNKLLWSTATETNNSGWEIESKGTGNKDEGTWRKTGFVAGKGTTTEKQNYSFSVSSFQSSVSQRAFRLKQIDTDGKFAYSNILTVNLTPEAYSLSQNYPNPFNPTTSINYQLKANSFVSLKVFDLLGREVKTLVNEDKPAGSFSVNFSAVDLPSGVYFYKLSAGSFSETRKMTVMK